MKKSLKLAASAGIQPPQHSLLQVAGKQALLARRFYRLTMNPVFAGISEQGTFHGIGVCQEDKLLKIIDKKGLLIIEWE